MPPIGRVKKLSLILVFVLILFGVYLLLTSLQCGRPLVPPTPSPTPTITVSPTPKTPGTPTPSPTPSTPTTPTPLPPSQMLLRWVNTSGDGAVLDGNVLKPGKPVRLEEVYNDAGPTSFQVFEVYDSVFDRLIRRYGSMRPKANFNATKVQAWTAHSDRPWVLPAPSQFRGQSTFHFTDDRNYRSGKISSSSIGQISWKLPVELLSEAGILKVKGEVKLEGSLIFAVDPEVSLVLLLPWGTGSENLKGYLAPYLEELKKNNPEISPADWWKDFDGYLPPQPPRGWEVSLSPPRIAGGPREPGMFTLKIATPTAGKTLLGIKAVLQGSPSVVVSEVIGIDGAPR